LRGHPVAGVRRWMPPKLPNGEITFVQENPKRAGTKAHERYEKYKMAKTVEEAVRSGALRADVTNDMKMGFCKAVGSNRGPESAPCVAQECGERAAAKRSADEALVVQDEVAQQPPSKRPPPLTPSAGPGGAPSGNVEAPAPAPAPADAVGVAEAAAAPSKEAAAVSAAASTSRPAGVTAAQLSEVDLSFAELDGKPLKFVKRVMGEARRLLCSHGLEEAEKNGYRFTLEDRQNLSKWKVQLYDLNPEGHLAKDLRKHNLDPCIDLELTLLDGFPLEPPFARVLYPQLSGGYVFSRGGICFEPLTSKGWVPTMTLPALAIAIKGILDYGEVRVAGVGNREARKVAQYTFDGAQKDHAQIVSAHRGGEGSTYGSLKRYAS